MVEATKVVNDAKAINADPDKTESIDRATNVLRPAGFASLKSGQLLINIVAVLLALGLAWVFPDLPSDDQVRATAAIALVPLPGCTRTPSGGTAYVLRSGDHRVSLVELPGRQHGSLQDDNRN
jgi:hypothetical protein